MFDSCDVNPAVKKVIQAFSKAISFKLAQVNLFAHLEMHQEIGRKNKVFLTQSMTALNQLVINQIAIEFLKVAY